MGRVGRYLENEKGEVEQKREKLREGGQVKSSKFIGKKLCSAEETSSAGESL